MESICSINILPEICFGLSVGCRLCGVFIGTRDGNLVWELPKVHMVVKVYGIYFQVIKFYEQCSCAQPR